jgi:hypothetical protein
LPLFDERPEEPDGRDGALRPLLLGRLGREGRLIERPGDLLREGGRLVLRWGGLAVDLGDGVARRVVGGRLDGGVDGLEVDRAVLRGGMDDRLLVERGVEVREGGRCTLS